LTRVYIRQKVDPSEALSLSTYTFEAIKNFLKIREAWLPKILGVEHDYLEVFASTGCIPQVVYTPLNAGGCRGDLSPLWGFGGAHPPLAGGSKGQRSLGGGFRASAPKAKNRCKIAL